MFEHNLLIFAVIGIAGLAIIIMGFKFSEKTRKVAETTGAIIFHVGVFGILYYKVATSLFISLVTLVISLFILIDPLKIGNYLNAKIYRLCGYLALFISVAFSLDYFSGFPVWLWAIPVVIYLSPYLISPLKNKLKLILALAWLVVLVYVGLIGYVIYTKYNPAVEVKSVTGLLPKLHVPGTDGFEARPYKSQIADEKTRDLFVEDTTKPVDTPPTPSDTTTDSAVTAADTTKPPVSPTTDGPFLKGLQQADEKFITLQKEFDTLKAKYEKLERDYQTLKKELDGMKAKDKKTETL